MFLAALMAMTAALAGSVWSVVAQRDRERELMFVGREYRRAIERYRADHARLPQPYPTALAQLLGDREQQLVVRRYLRRLYPDPITGSSQWGLLRNPQGGIVGVYSLSERPPLRRRGAYIDEAIDWARARSHRDWVFAARNLGPGGPGGAGGAGLTSTAGAANPAATAGNAPLANAGQPAALVGAEPEAPAAAPVLRRAPDPVDWNYAEQGAPPPRWASP
jgi:type II secretory pathway pseudopilin PulG